MKTGKKLLSVLLSLLLVLGAVSVGGMTVSADDDGIAWNEAENRYEISSYAGLKKFADIVNGIENPDEPLNPQAACAKLMNDIDASASDPGLPGYDPSNAWTPIGKDNSHKYTGTFDGDGYVITGLTFDDSSVNDAGFFGKVYRVKEGDEIVGGIVKNVGIEDGKITGSQNVGGVAGYNNGLITGCYFKGSVSGSSCIGGIAGINDDTIENCYNTGEVSGDIYIGGVTGYNYGGTVRNCFNTAKISGNRHIGGVVGGNINSSFTNCLITNCYNTGEVSGELYVGGVTGYLYNNAVSNSYTTGNINPGTGASDIGIIVGRCEGLNGGTAKVKNCYYDSDEITGFSEIGVKRGEVETSSLTGLTTAQMTGENALRNMVFEYGDGEVSPWLTKANGADVSGKYRLFYPHLTGFAYDTESTAENWPARLEITVSTTEFTYTGAPEHPLKEDIIIVSGSMDIPDEFADKTVKYSIWNEVTLEWDEIPASSVENPGRYRMTVIGSDETELLFKRYFTVLETGDINMEISAVNGNTSATGADAGDYEAKIQFAKYGNIEITVPYKINPADAEISVTAEDANCGEMVKATVTASAGIGNDFTVTLEKQKSAGEWEEVIALPSGITNGTQLDIGGLSAGDYKLTVSHTGGNYAACSASVEFSVNIIDPGMELTISPEQPVWGDDITITATLPESATGTVTFRFDEADTGVEVAVENGKAVYAIEGKSIEVGDHNVLASYSGDERYNSVSEELPFAVNKAETEVHITVEPGNPVYGQEISITATVDGDAKIINFSEHGSTSLGGATLFIDGGVIYTLASETDTVTFNVPGLDAGEHTIKVVYNGDEHYWSAEGETTIFVGRSEPEITVTAGDITYGESVQATVTVPDNATGNITAGLLKYGGIDPDTNEEIWNTVNGAPSSITSGEQFEISGLAAGDYKLTVSLGEDSNYFSGSAEKAFKVNKAEPDMSVTVMLSAVNGEAVAPGESVTAEVGDKLTFAGKAANNGNVTLTNVIVLDRLTGTTYAVGSLKPGEVSEEIQVLHIVTAADALAGKIVDSVKVTVEVDDGEDVSSVAEVEVSVRTEYKVTYVVDGEELTTLDATFGQSVPQPRTPQKEGYTFAWVDEIPETMPAEDVTINGTFTIIKYTATFVKEDGTELETIEYDVETTSIDEPEVPAKEGYEGAWEEYEIGAGNITIKPVYTPANICKLDREYHGDTFWGRLVTFVHNLIWTAFSFIGLDIFFSIKRG